MSNAQLTRTRRLDSLTGLRIFAALLVFAHHATAYQAVGGIPSLLTQSGIDGVSFFFILSGFVLAWSSRLGDKPSRFLRRRVARIVPLYLLAWACGAALAVLWRTPGGLVNLVPSVFLVQSWSPDPAVHFAGNSVAWSLSAEAFFYITFPLLIPLLRRLQPKHLGWVIVACVTIVIGAAVAFHPTSPSGFGYWFIYVCPLVRLPEFLAGATAALLMRTGYRVRFPFPVAVALAVAVVAAANWMPLYLLFSAATIIPFLLVIVTAAQRDIDGRGSFASWRPIAKLGEWSYAFYLFHLLVLRVMININSHFGLPWWVVGTVTLVVALGVSGLVCELVEKPLERRLRGDNRLPVSLQDPPVNAENTPGPLQRSEPGAKS